jgi:hypothetical protein
MNDETAEPASLSPVLPADWFNARWVARISAASFRTVSLKPVS